MPDSNSSGATDTTDTTESDPFLENGKFQLYVSLGAAGVFLLTTVILIIILCALLVQRSRKRRSSLPNRQATELSDQNLNEFEDPFAEYDMDTPQISASVPNLSGWPSLSQAHLRQVNTVSPMLVQNPTLTTPPATNTGQRQQQTTILKTPRLRKSNSLSDIKTYENLSKLRQQSQTPPTVGIPSFLWQSVKIPKREQQLQPPSPSNWNARPVSPSEWKPMPVPRNNKGISLMVFENQPPNEVYDDLVPHTLTTTTSSAAMGGGGRGLPGGRSTKRKPLYQHLEVGSLEADSEYKVLAVKRYV